MEKEEKTMEEVVEVAVEEKPAKKPTKKSKKKKVTEKSPEKVILEKTVVETVEPNYNYSKVIKKEKPAKINFSVIKREKKFY